MFANFLFSVKPELQKAVVQLCAYRRSKIYAVLTVRCDILIKNY